MQVPCATRNILMELCLSRSRLRLHKWLISHTTLQLCFFRAEKSFFACTIASEKKVAAFHASAHPRTMASIKTGRKRSPPPIASRRTRRCSAQAGHTSTICSAVSSTRSTQWSRRIRSKSLTKKPCLVRTRFQTEREYAVASLQPLLKEGPYHRDCSLPSTVRVWFPRQNYPVASKTVQPFSLHRLKILWYYLLL